MVGWCSVIAYPLIRKLGRRDGGESSRLNSNRRHSPVRILNEDILLNIFHLYRTDTDDTQRTVAWPRRNWWYNLAHVCRLWRNIILGSPSQLDLHLFCTNGVPVADMLAHSPPLPLTIYYHNWHRWGMSAEDESGILLALSHRDRVRQIYFWEVRNVGKLVTAMDDQFPILECMYIDSSTEVNLPVRFQAPNLRHLKLRMASLPIGSPLFNTAAGLVTLSLHDTPPSPHYPPSYILAPLSIMVQLESLSIRFYHFFPKGDIEGQSHQMVTLANLQRFEFQGGVSAYLESLVAHISAPSLNTLQVYFRDRPSFTVPRLLQFIQASKNLTVSAVEVTFQLTAVSIHAVPWKRDTPLLLMIGCRYLDSQVASAAQLFHSLSPILSVVEHVTISYKHNRSLIPGSPNDPDQIRWCELLRPFTNAKVVNVHDHLVDKIFHSLSSDDRAQPLSLRILPKLEEVGYFGSDVLQMDAITAFLNGRQGAGHPTSLRMLDPSFFDEHLAMYIYTNQCWSNGTNWWIEVLCPDKSNK